MIPSNPTGLSTKVYRNEIITEWINNPETDVKGYNIYNSTTSGGGVSGYIKLNNELIEQFTEEREDVLNTTTQVVYVGNTKTTTTAQQIKKTLIFSYSHTNLTQDVPQYYVITAVNTAGEESPYSIEVWATPLIVSVDVITPPLRTQNDVSLDYIATLLDRQPNLDVKPGSVTRQLHIDPNSLEFSYAYTRIDFIYRAQSVLTLRQLDDANNDRVSDDVATSTYKQSLKTAYFFANDADVQTMIDTAFDKIGSNCGTFREGATSGIGMITFYTTLAPTKDINVPINTFVSTVPTETSPAIRFYTLSSGTILVANLVNYYNPITQQYELTLPIQAESTGANTNVGTNTIVVSTVVGLNCTNNAPTYDGRNTESNADYGDRIQLAFQGLDVGTVNGYKRVVTAIAGVEDVIIVDAGSAYMQRDYDDVRNKHVYGKVDIYVKGGVPAQYTDTIGFLFKEDIDQSMIIINVADMIIKTSNINVTSLKPIYLITEITNVTQGAQNYDLFGNCTVYRNAVAMVKGTDITVDLPSGVITFITTLNLHDIITADYDYKKQVTGEVVVSVDPGGNVNFNLDFSPIVKNSYTIYKNSVAMVDGVDYNLNLTNGYFQLTSGTTPGDTITADYKYIISLNGMTQETVISDATGIEVTANLANANVLESFTIQSDGQSIDLEQTNVINASIGMLIGDVIVATYRYRDSDPYILLTQPATSIISITGSISGVLEPGINYTFNDIDDILLEGNSTKATRYINFIYANNMPVGNLTSTIESITLLNNDYKALSQKGIDTESIIVKIGATTYYKGLDYFIAPEADGINVSIARTKNTNIPNGSTVAVSYQYGELLTIVYTCNPLIQQVQNQIKPVKNVTADVLVKEVLETLVNYEIGVVLKKGTDEIAAATDIKNAIYAEHGKLTLGQGIAQSDIIRVVEGISNVISVVAPSNHYGMMTKMVKADGTQVNREKINAPFAPYQSSVVMSYKAVSALINNTLGAATNYDDGFYAVFEDDRPLTLILVATDVDNAAGQAYIGSNGDLVVSTIEGDTPMNHIITVCYVVSGETGAEDIEVSTLEYVYPNEIIIHSITQT